MSILDITEVDIPTGEDTPNDFAPGEGMLTCEQCGNHFEHSGRGRKPKRCLDCRSKATGTATRTPSRKSTPKDVETALAVLDGMYSTLSIGLFIVSPNAASVWAGQTDQLQTTNRVTLAGDPALTKSICRLGERTGKAAFILAHVVAAVPVVIQLREDSNERRKERAKNPPPSESGNPNGSESRHPYTAPPVTTTTRRVGNMDFFG